MTISSDNGGRPDPFALHRQASFLNCLCHVQICFPVDAFCLYFLENARCTFLLDCVWTSYFTLKKIKKINFQLSFYTFNLNLKSLEREFVMLLEYKLMYNFLWQFSIMLFSDTGWYHISIRIKDNQFAKNVFIMAHERRNCSDHIGKLIFKCFSENKWKNQNDRWNF